MHSAVVDHSYRNIVRKNSKRNLPNTFIKAEKDVCIFSNSLRIITSFNGVYTLMLDLNIYTPLREYKDVDFDSILRNTSSLSIGIVGKDTHDWTGLINSLKQNLPQDIFDIIVIYADMPIINDLPDSGSNYTWKMNDQKRCCHILVHHKPQKVILDIVIVYEIELLWYTGSIDSGNCIGCDTIYAHKLPFAKARLFPAMETVNRTILQNITVWIPDPHKYSYSIDYMHSEFIPCDYQRSAIFLKKYPYIITPGIKRSQVRVTILLFINAVQVDITRS